MTVESVIDFSIFDLGGLPLVQKSPKAETTYYPPRSTIPQNFSPIVETVYEICITKVFHFLGLANPWAKVHQRSEDLADSEIYHPTEFHCSTSTHARDTCYQNSADKETKKQTNKQ